MLQSEEQKQEVMVAKWDQQVFALYTQYQLLEKLKAPRLGECDEDGGKGFTEKWEQLNKAMQDFAEAYYG